MSGQLLAIALGCISNQRVSICFNLAKSSKRTLSKSVHCLARNSAGVLNPGRPITFSRLAGNYTLIGVFEMFHKQVARTITVPTFADIIKTNAR